MHTQETKERILDQTFDLLLRKGYDGVSITDIQQTLGISRGLLYHYFGNKEALFQESLERAFLSNFQIDLELVAGYDLAQMSAYMVGKYRTLGDDVLKGTSILNYDFLFYRAMQESPHLAQHYQRVRDDELRGWFLALSNSRRQGQLRSDLNPDLGQLARQFIYVTDGVWLSAVTPSTGLDLISGLEEALVVLRRLLCR